MMIHLMKWFRLYHEVYRNPKVQALRPELFRFWINFLCVANESKRRGTIPSVSHLKFALGLNEATLKRYLSDLEGAALLHRGDDGTLIPHDWYALQRDSDDAAKLKSDQRKKGYDDSANGMSRDMSQDRSRDMSQNCPPSRARDSDSDSDSDPEEEKKPPPHLRDASPSDARNATTHPIPTIDRDRLRRIEAERRREMGLPPRTPGGDADRR